MPVELDTSGSTAPIAAVPHRDAPTGRGERSAHGRSVALGLALRLIAAGPLFVLMCIWVMFAILSSHFFTSSNLTNILIQAGPVALLALGALVVVVIGSLDISLGTTSGLCSVVGAVLFRDHPSLGWLVIPAMAMTGMLVGAVNSFVIVTLRIGNAFIVTLGMFYVVQSLSYVISGGSQVPGMPHLVLTLANNHLAGIPLPIIVVVLAGGMLAFVLNRVVWGRWIFAIGGNSDAAGKVGIPVRKVRFSVYVIAGLFAALTGVLVGGYDNAGAADSGTSVLLAIAAVVVGGASLTGGRGSVWATIVGAVILTSITNGLTLLNVSPYWTPFAVGAVLVAAVGIDALRQNVEGRLRIRQAKLQAEGL